MLAKKSPLITNSKFGNFFLLIFENQLVSLLNKNKKKKIINIFTFLNQIKIAIRNKLPVIFFYSRPYFLSLLNVLRDEFFIFNYFKISLEHIPLFLTTSVDKKFLQNLVCIIFKPTNLFGNLHTLNNITCISTPGRTIYISYHQLAKLVNMNTTVLYILNTPLGLVSHKTALKNKIGGSLLCQIS